MNNYKFFLIPVALVGVLIIALLLLSNPLSADISEYESTEIDEKHYEGIDLLSSRFNEEVYLANGDNITKTWDVSVVPNSDPSMRYQYPMVLEDGDLIYVDYSGKIARISESNESGESDLLWDSEFGHHDVAQYNNTLLTFNRSVSDSEILDRPIEDELIYRVDPKTGQKIGRPASIQDMIKDTELVDVKELYEDNLLQGRSDDILNEVFSYQGKNNSVRLFHANSIYVLNQDYDETFREGRVLVSLRNLDTVILFDWEDKEIVWTSSGVNLDRQHHPTMTSDGNIMIYDNGEVNRNYTRVIEVSPDKEIQWAYSNPEYLSIGLEDNMTSGDIQRSETDDKFYSAYMGSAQELPNGNVLITDSMGASAFEVTEDKNIVWNSSTDKEGDRIFRLNRFKKSCLDEVIEGDRLTSRICQQHPYRISNES